MGRIVACGIALVLAGCASLGSLASIVQAPRFEEERERPAQVVLIAPGRDHALGGAGIRIWTRVTNPNPFGLTLSSLVGDLYLEDVRAAAVDFPLGLPLLARGETLVPIELSIGFADLPRLAQILTRDLGGRVRYRLDGRVAVDAGPLGRPSFGPHTLIEGDARLR